MCHGADDEMEPPQQSILRQVGKGVMQDLEQKFEGRFELIDENGSDGIVRLGKGMRRQGKKTSSLPREHFRRKSRFDKSAQTFPDPESTVLQGGVSLNNLQPLHAMLINRPPPTFNDLFDQGHLGAEMIIDRRLIHLRLGGESFDGCAMEAVTREKAFRRVQNAQLGV